VILGAIIKPIKQPATRTSMCDKSFFILSSLLRKIHCFGHQLSSALRLNDMLQCIDFIPIYFVNATELFFVHQSHS